VGYQLRPATKSPAEAGLSQLGITPQEGVCVFYQTGEGLRSRLSHTDHGRKLGHLFQLGPRLRQHASNSSFATSSDPARLSVRRLPGKCSAQNQRSPSGPLRIS
jgi:hypothetical protein